MALRFAAMAAYARLAVVPDARGRAARPRRSVAGRRRQYCLRRSEPVWRLPESLIQLSGPWAGVELRLAFAAFAQDYRTSDASRRASTCSSVCLADPVADRIVVSRCGSPVEVAAPTRPAAAHPVRLPSQRRPDPRGDGDAAGLDGQRRPARCRRCALAGPGDDVDARAESIRACQLSGWGPVLGSAPGCRSSPTGIMVRIGRLPEEERVLR